MSTELDLTTKTPEEHAKTPERLSQVADIRMTLECQAARRFLWRVLEKAGIFQDTFRPNSTSAYLQGKAALGRFLFNEILEACPELHWGEQFLQVMLREPEEETEKEEDNG